MAVDKLDLKTIWDGGLTYDKWLAACNEKCRTEMERIYAEVPMSAEYSRILKAMTRPVHLLAIAEDWCGDVRRNVPVVARISAENAEMIRLRCVDKETQPQLMVRYLTNAAEAIPIIVFLNETFVEVGNWGPRPFACKRFMARGKAAGKIDEARERIAAFYNSDKHQSTVTEIRALIDTASTTEI